MRDAWKRADEMGVDTIWNWDHFYPLRGAEHGKHFECWTLLGAMAEVTEKAEIGALVTCNSYRNPNLLADMARTVDHISGGRLILGIGAGWFERDYDEYGYEFGTAGSRLRELRAALPIIEARLGQLNPPPTRKLPLMIGGGGEKVTLRITAEYADMWNGFAGDIGQFEHKNRVLNDWCEKVGRAPDDIERSAILTEPDQIELADQIVGAGANHLILARRGPDYDLAPLESLIEWRDRTNAA